MADSEQSRPDFLAVDVDEARKQAFALIKSLGDLVWGVKEAEALMPDVGSTDPAFGAVADSLNAARNDALKDVNGHAERVCAVVFAVYEGIVTIDEIDQEVAADLQRRRGEL